MVEWTPEGTGSTAQSREAQGRQHKLPQPFRELTTVFGHLKRQRFDAHGESLHRFRELSILPKHLHKEGRLVRRDRHPFLACGLQTLTMFRIGPGMSGVAVGLAGLSWQYQWSRICPLQANGEVEEDEWIDVERCKPEDIDQIQMSTMTV